MKNKLSKEAIDALSYSSKNHGTIEWIALDVFRAWYQKPYEEGIELLYKTFQVIEIDDDKD